MRVWDTDTERTTYLLFPDALGPIKKFNLGPDVCIYLLRCIDDDDDKESFYFKTLPKKKTLDIETQHESHMHSELIYIHSTLYTHENLDHMYMQEIIERFILSLDQKKASTSKQLYDVRKTFFQNKGTSTLYYTWTLKMTYIYMWFSQSIQREREREREREMRKKNVDRKKSKNKKWFRTRIDSHGSELHEIFDFHL